MINSIDKGKLGELIACKYLVEKGYIILDKNFREKWGEIDIIARSPNQTLVFVEVKALKKNSWLMPEDNLSKQKLLKLQKICHYYVNKNAALIKEKYGWQIDLVAVTLPEEEIAEADLKLTEIIKHCIINHYENI